MTSPALSASIIGKLGNLGLFDHQWFRKRPTTEEGKERQGLLETVIVFFRRVDDGRRGYDACVLKLEHLRDELTGLHDEVESFYRVDHRLSTDFAREYESHMKELNHIISIARLHVLLIKRKKEKQHFLS